MFTFSVGYLDSPFLPTNRFPTPKCSWRSKAVASGFCFLEEKSLCLAATCENFDFRIYFACMNRGQFSQQFLFATAFPHDTEINYDLRLLVNQWLTMSWSGKKWQFAVNGLKNVKLKYFRSVILVSGQTMTHTHAQFSCNYNIYIPLLWEQQYSGAQALWHISSGCCVSPWEP